MLRFTAAITIFFRMVRLVVCTMQGDVWRVDGIDSSLNNLTWRRIASGLHQTLGLVVVEDVIHLLGRDQITRLHDKNADGEIDFYECFSNVFDASAGGHDYMCGLVRDDEGRFYTSSGSQGLLRISADGSSVELLATGLRNSDGVGIMPDGTITAANSEGDWVPSSMVCAVRRDPARTSPLHFGHKGPKDSKAPICRWSIYLVEWTTPAVDRSGVRATALGRSKITYCISHSVPALLS